MLSADTPDVIALAEEILWKRVPSNTAVLTSLEEQKLKHSDSIPEMRQLLKTLGHQLRIVHVTGSKGKGSTAAFVESILRHQGLKTALFTSPHLVHPRERLRWSGQSMDFVAFSEAIIDVYECLKRNWAGSMPGLFRFMTLMAFDQMIKARQRGELDVAIVEVGMGGRYDATNVIEKPSITAISSLSMEHVRSLGPTLADIAYHKAGIAKKNVPLISVPQPTEAVDVITKVAALVGANLEFVESLNFESLNPESFVTESLKPNSLNSSFFTPSNPGSACSREIKLGNLPDPFLLSGIDGTHQRLNAALAIRVARKWWEIHYNTSFPGGLVRRALEETFWPGRHQIFQTGLWTWFLDGAHTIESIEYALVWFKKHLDSGQKSILAFHVSHDRSFERLLEPVIEFSKSAPFCQVYFVKPSSPTDSLYQNSDMSLHEKMASYWKEQTLQSAQFVKCEDLGEMLPNTKCQVLVMGSLYLVGDMIRILGAPIDKPATCT